MDEVISRAATEHEIDPALIRSIIAAESGFDADATSPRGAVGLMQIMPGTARELGYDARDNEGNVLAGSKYLSSLIQKYKDFPNGLQRAIAAYNSGPGSVNRYRGIPPFRETRKYVKRVLALHSKFKRSKSSLALVRSARPAIPN